MILPHSLQSSLMVVNVRSHWQQIKPASVRSALILGQPALVLLPCIDTNHAGEILAILPFWALFYPFPSCGLKTASSLFHVTRQRVLALHVFSRLSDS